VEIKGATYTVDIGTAGSISLLLQCIMPMTAFSRGEITLEVTGGTDVAWSPTMDYLNNVTCKALEQMGYRCNIETLKRGYYPEGGGKVRAALNLRSYMDLSLKDRNLILKEYLMLRICLNMWHNANPRQLKNCWKARELNAR
jgi:RNA 3'-terminal phosphate cyclase (ATP)